MDWYLKVLRNYVGFGGRARRKEYWMFVLVNFVLIMVLGIVSPPFMVCWFCCLHGPYCFVVFTTPIVRRGGCCCC